MKNKKQILAEQKEALKNRLTCLNLLDDISFELKEMVIDNYTYWTQIDNNCTIQLANFKEVNNPIFEQHGK
jgi:hypothetical protein